MAWGILKGSKSAAEKCYRDWPIADAGNARNWCRISGSGNDKDRTLIIFRIKREGEVRIKLLLTLRLV